jgi:hypothetical protein
MTTRTRPLPMNALQPDPAQRIVLARSAGHRAR